MQSLRLQELLAFFGLNIGHCRSFFSNRHQKQNALFQKTSWIRIQTILLLLLLLFCIDIQVHIKKLMIVHVSNQIQKAEARKFFYDYCMFRLVNHQNMLEQLNQKESLKRRDLCSTAFWTTRWSRLEGAPITLWQKHNTLEARTHMHYKYENAYIKCIRYLLNLEMVKLQKNYYNIVRVDVSKIPTVSEFSCTTLICLLI